MWKTVPHGDETSAGNETSYQGRLDETSCREGRDELSGNWQLVAGRDKLPGNSGRDEVLGSLNLWLDETSEVSRVQPCIVHHLQTCKCNSVMCVFCNLIIFVHRSPKGEE